MPAPEHAMCVRRDFYRARNLGHHFCSDGYRLGNFVQFVTIKPDATTTVLADVQVGGADFNFLQNALAGRAFHRGFIIKTARTESRQNAKCGHIIFKKSCLISDKIVAHRNDF